MSGHEWFSWVNGDEKCDVRLSDVVAVVERPSPSAGDLYIRGGVRLDIGQADALRLKAELKAR